MTTEAQPDVWALFHENTKITPFENGEDRRNLPETLTPDLVLGRVRLPPVTLDHPATLESAIYNRRTGRTFDPHRPLSIELLSRLLACSYGYTTPVSYPTLPHIAYRRPAPSAGATYPLEVYPVVLRVAGVQPGVYRYAANDHSLELRRAGQFNRALAQWMLHQPYVADAGAVFVIAATPERITPSYGERGYRYLLLEAGHIAQNLYLLAAAYGLDVLSNGGFVDEAVNRLVGLDGVNELALYLAAVGVPAKR